MPTKCWDDFEVGDKVVSQGITITDAHLVNWAGLTMDFYPLHMDEEYAKKTIFKGILNPFEATRYHSLVVEKKSFPEELEIIAWTKDNEIMGLKHKQYPVWGVQFHPESILTKSGKDILRNFLEERIL